MQSERTGTSKPENRNKEWTLNLGDIITNNKFMTSENTVPAYDRVTEQHWDKSMDRWETETSPLYVLVWRISASRCTLVTVWGSVVYLCKNIQTVEWTKFLQISWFWDEILQWIKNHKRQSPLDSIHTSESLYETSMERCDMPSTFHFNTRYLCVMKQLLVYTIIANLSEGFKKKNKLFLCVYSDIFPQLLEHLPGTTFLCVLGGSEGAWAIIIDDNSP